MSSSCAEMLEAAKFYTDHGWIITALSAPNTASKSAGKAPVGTGWQNHPTVRTEKYIIQHWGKEGGMPENIGLQCGERSGVIVLDCDDNNPYVIGGLFEGLDTSKWVKQQRTPSRWHYLFKYTQRLPNTKHYKKIGIDLLSNGGNCVLSPSNHKSGDVYEFVGSKPCGSKDLPEMPNELVSRLLKLFETAEKLEQAVRSSRICFKTYFTEHAEITKNPDNWHSDEGHKAALATGIEFATEGAGREELELMAKIMYREDYNASETASQLDSILKYKSKPDGKPWRCDTIRAECPRITVDPKGKLKTLCDDCKRKDAVPKARKPMNMEKSTAYFNFLKKGEQQAVASDEFLERYPCVHFKGYGLATYTDGIYVPLQEENTDKIILGLVNEWDYAPTATELKNIRSMINIKAHKPDEMFLGENNPELVALDNCILNLCTGETTEYNKDIIIFNKLPIAYDPNATDKPMFDKCMKEIFKGKEIGIKQYQEAGGYCLFRGYPIHAFFVFIGTGGNGKSQLIKILLNMLGEANITAYSMQDFFSPKESSIAAEHHNKMANLSSETAPKTIKSTNTGKALTGGDAVTARRLYLDPFTFISFSKAFFSANSVPIIEDNTNALIQRMVPIILPNKFRNTPGQVLDLADRIKEAGEMPAILNWFIEGFKRLMEQKHFTRANSAESDAAMYARLSRPFDYFVDEYCYESEGYDVEFTTAADVTEALMTYREMYPQSADFGNKFAFKKNIEDACRANGLRKVKYTQKRATPGHNPQKVYMNLIIDIELLNVDYAAAMRRRAEDSGDEVETSKPLQDMTKEVELSQEQRELNAAFEMLVRALSTYMKTSKYHGFVGDLTEFVDSFNLRDPEYEVRLGYNSVYETASRLVNRGRY